MKNLKKQFLNLAIGEFAAIMVFIYAFRTFNLGPASLGAFAFLIFLLLQGSTYWLYRYKLIVARRPPSNGAIKILKLAKQLNLVISVVVVISMLIVKRDLKDLVIAILIYVFALIELINYYWYRLSYGKTGFNIKILISEGLQASSINKLINKER
ncbi:hypothetical protein [Alkaliphilus transvaalensis]|uniref:hypothetical protein n=1 Tax=Alkaliphilus transvaalensis TaxID=114628 RepID=UPI00047DC62A|nr:hypothetical protein [Alkaliphilus transvaalensis]